METTNTINNTDLSKCDLDKNNIHFLNFLKKVNIIHNSLLELDGLLIHRDDLINKEIEKFEEDISNIKKIYTVNSCCITSLKKSSKEKQKWPVLNLTRQILKTLNYNMKPIRKANGYTLEGKKLYKRFFQINKINKIK
tara:strand:+ start:197 stop:610 length:414 start_codon:yes stop_codon:yes gene_type:complete